LTQHNSPQNTASTGQIIALAALVQSAYLVDQIATKGNADPASFNPIINSLFQFDAQSPMAIYGSIHGLDLGIKILTDLLSGRQTTPYRAAIRYAMSILHLQKKASQNTNVMSTIKSRLEHAAINAEHFTDNSQQIAASCAGIYQDTISQFKYRIQINGSMQQLQNPQNAEQIRALLLGGIRAAVLWRQMGGHRWHFLLSRKRLLAALKELQH
jgi:high frequency lysogenization protein